jgi:hypothetical protein
MLAGLGSSRPSMVPRLLMPTPTPLPRPPSEPEALGLAGAAPPTPPVGPQTRWLPSTPRKSPPRWAPERATHWGGALGKSWCRTVTWRCRRRCHRPPPRLSRREIPRAGARRGSVCDDASSTPPAQGPCGLDASRQRLSPPFFGPPRGVEPPERPDLSEPVATFL